MGDFGKLNFSTSFNPTSAFPLDARSYFNSLESAQAAASTAEEVGSTTTRYHYGQRLMVDLQDGTTPKWYVIQADKTLIEDGVGGGDNSLGIKSIEQIVKSEEDDGVNIIKITFTDNTFTNFEIQNGSKGSSGVYVGSGEMPEGYNIQIDPDSDADEYVTKEEYNSLLQRVAALEKLIEGGIPDPGPEPDDPEEPEPTVAVLGAAILDQTILA